MARKKTPAEPVTKERWAICQDSLHKFVADADGKIATTTDRKEAERVASGIGGRVVNADVWAKDPKFLPQASRFQLFGPHGIEVGLSTAGGERISAVRIARASFRPPKRGTTASRLVLEIEYESTP